MIENEKVISFLRSAFRMKKMKETFAPSSILKLETSIFNNRLSVLSTDEILQALSCWNTYVEDNQVQDEIDDLNLVQNIERDLSTLN